MDDDWTNPEHPPVESIDLGGGVWASWATGWVEVAEDGRRFPLIWHWCDRSVAKANAGPEVQDWWLRPRWMGAGCRGHDLVSSDPLTLSPSLSLPDCCGLHGFIENGRWRSV